MNEQLRRLILGDRQRIAGTVYGTIIVTSVLAAGAKSYEHQLWRLVAIAAVSVVVLWFAHVYSHALGCQATRSCQRRDSSCHRAAPPPEEQQPILGRGVLSDSSVQQLARAVGRARGQAPAYRATRVSTGIAEVPAAGAKRESVDLASGRWRVVCPQARVVCVVLLIHATRRAKSTPAAAIDTTRMPAHQARATHALEPLWVPRSSPRSVSVSGVIG